MPEEVLNSLTVKELVVGSSSGSKSGMIKFSGSKLWVYTGSDWELISSTA